jgi:single-stranded-DNA-specific exonuclease
LRGSARSVAGVHIRDVLEAVDTQHPGLIERYGGHAMAAGLTLQSRDMTRFAQAFADEVGRRLTPEQMQGVLESDGELGPAELTVATAQAIEQGGPWGPGFPEPLFDGEFGVVDSRLVGERHLKLWLRSVAAAPPVEAIAFGHFDAAGAIRPPAGARLRLAYRLQSSDWGGSARAELVAEHVEGAP